MRPLLRRLAATLTEAFRLHLVGAVTSIGFTLERDSVLDIDTVRDHVIRYLIGVGKDVIQVEATANPDSGFALDFNEKIVDFVIEGGRLTAIVSK